jgi:hypothetical protein
VGGAHSGVSPGADDNVMPGFDGSGSGFGRGESGNRLMANAGVPRNGPSMSSAAAVDGQADDWAYRYGGGDGGGACASLVLRYHRIYNMYASDASRSGLSTEFTSGLSTNATVGLPYIPPSSITLATILLVPVGFPYVNHSSLDRVRMNLGGIHTSRPSTRTAHILVFI